MRVHCGGRDRSPLVQRCQMKYLVKTIGESLVDLLISYRR